MLQVYYSWLKERITTDPDLQDRGIVVDWYFRQYYSDRSAEDDGMVIHTPVCYVEILPIQWRTLPGSIQRAVLGFRLHILTSTVHADDRSMVLPEVTADTNGDHLLIRERIYTRLMNQRVKLSDVPVYLGGVYRIDNQDAVAMESIIRISSPTVTAQLDDLILSIEEFQCVVTDYTASPAYQRVEDVDLEVNCETIVQP